MIIADHKKAGDKLKAILEGKGVARTFPIVLAPNNQKMLDQLQGAKGKDFGSLYLDAGSGPYGSGRSLPELCRLG